MKKISIIIVFVGALVCASCSSVSKLASNASSTTQPSAGTIQGTACGKVLGTMYTQYKSTGKVDMKNSSTLLSVTELSTHYSSLRNNKSNTTYLYSFAKGLVSGTNGLVNTSNSLSSVNSLLSLSSLSSITSTTPATSTASTNVASGLTALFNSWKK